MEMSLYELLAILSSICSFFLGALATVYWGTLCMLKNDLKETKTELGNFKLDVSENYVKALDFRAFSKEVTDKLEDVQQTTNRIAVDVGVLTERTKTAV
jgi:hypothetical protein